MVLLDPTLVYSNFIFILKRIPGNFFWFPLKLKLWKIATLTPFHQSEVHTPPPPQPDWLSDYVHVNTATAILTLTLCDVLHTCLLQKFFAAVIAVVVAMVAVFTSTSLRHLKSCFCSCRWFCSCLNAKLQLKSNC